MQIKQNKTIPQDIFLHNVFLTPNIALLYNIKDRKLKASLIEINLI